MRRISLASTLALLALLLCGLSQAADLPTTLRVVDLRWINGQPELETWLGSLQGTLNRQPEQAPVFLIGTDTNAAWADTLQRMYGLTVERFTPGALLEASRPALTGQVRYDPKEPWSRNVALTAAACAPGAVIATPDDLGLPTTLDLRGRWTNRLDAYAWLIDTYADKASREEWVQAPESGHLLADLIAARKLLAVDYAPDDNGAEGTALTRLLLRRPGARVLGTVDDRVNNPSTAELHLLAQLQGNSSTLVPVRDVANLSCFARFPSTRPLLQGYREVVLEDAKPGLVLIYDNGDALQDGSLDYASRLLNLLRDPALTGLPVAIPVPTTLAEYAPSAYQALLACQRTGSFEFIAAPNGDGLAFPMSLADATAYLKRSAERAQRSGISAISILDPGAQPAYARLLPALQAQGWQGAIFQPLLPQDKQPRYSQVLPGFTALVANGRITSVVELRAVLAAKSDDAFRVYSIDPKGLPPATLQAMCTEIEGTHLLLTPSQAFRASQEFVAVLPFLQAKRDKGITNPRRERPTLKVVMPTIITQRPTAADPLAVEVDIVGAAPVLVARLTYQAPDGRLGAADLRQARGTTWTATLPPMLSGGTLTMSARVVEQGGFGITISAPCSIEIASVDSDKDGIDDTLEAYLLSDPQHPDTDGDGLPDGADGNPLQPDLGSKRLMAAITPPADGGYLVEAGTSTIADGQRVVPAGSTVRYRLPLQGLAAIGAALRVRSAGAGTISLNDAKPVALETFRDEVRVTDLPLDAAALAKRELTVALTAGPDVLRLTALALISNPQGPFVAEVTLTPAHPPAGVPVRVRAIVYDPDGMKGARLRYGNDPNALTTLELKAVEGGGGVLYEGTIPAQPGGSLLVYGVVGEDRQSNIAAEPLRLEPIGRTKAHSVALIGGRDLRGTWEARPIWNNAGRVSTRGAAEDHNLTLVRPGTYTAWVLAQPRERGLAISVRWNDYYGKDDRVHLAKEIAAGQPDGWYRLGTFTARASERYTVSVSPVGEAGYCAYGMVVFTQDDKFTPPLPHAGIDWYNTLTMTGITANEVVGRQITVDVQATGNLDRIAVTADQRSGSVTSTQTYTFSRDTDGHYVLDTRRLLPGAYDITAIGYRVTVEKGVRTEYELLRVTQRVMVPAR